jgi:hypothetical protein
VEITGVQYTNLENYTVLAGRPEYTIDMTGNYLMAGNVTQILTTVNNAINGFTYRPFSATIINAPYLWPMDQITFTDKDGNDHTCILTNVNFGINGTMSVEGKGESMQAASRDALSGMTKEQGVLVEQAREATQKLDDSLTQEEIFNRLTGNGAEQGLILYNGKLYLNASYISAGTVSADILKGGVLKLGGENNVNGVMQVYKANGDMVFQLNDNGAVMSGGSIQLSSNLGTENAVVKLQEELNEPLLIEYHGINIDAKTRLLGNGIEITNNNTGLQLYITSSGMSFSTNDTAWLIVNYYDGSPGLSIYGDLYVSNGASGSFTTADGKTVIVSGGIITSIA